MDCLLDDFVTLSWGLWKLSNMYFCAKKEKMTILQCLVIKLQYKKRKMYAMVSTKESCLQKV